MPKKQDPSWEYETPIIVSNSMYTSSTILRSMACPVSKSQKFWADNFGDILNLETAKSISKFYYRLDRRENILKQSAYILEDSSENVA